MVHHSPQKPLSETMRFPIEIQHLILEADPVNCLEGMSVMRLVCKGWRDHLATHWHQTVLQSQLNMIIPTVGLNVYSFRLRLPTRAYGSINVQVRQGRIMLYGDLNAIDQAVMSHLEKAADRKHCMLEYETEKGTKLTALLQNQGYSEKRVPDFMQELFPETIWLYRLHGSIKQ